MAGVPGAGRQAPLGRRARLQSRHWKLLDQHDMRPVRLYTGAPALTGVGWQRLARQLIFEREELINADGAASSCQPVSKWPSTGTPFTSSSRQTSRGSHWVTFGRHGVRQPEVVCKLPTHTFPCVTKQSPRSSPSTLLYSPTTTSLLPVLLRREASGQVLHRSLCMNVRVSVSRRGRSSRGAILVLSRLCRSLTRTRPDRDSRHHFAGAAQSH